MRNVKSPCVFTRVEKSTKNIFSEVDKSYKRLQILNNPETFQLLAPFYERNQQDQIPVKLDILQLNKEFKDLNIHKYIGKYLYRLHRKFLFARGNRRLITSSTSINLLTSKSSENSKTKGNANEEQLASECQSQIPQYGALSNMEFLNYIKNMNTREIEAKTRGKKNKSIARKMFNSEEKKKAKDFKESIAMQKSNSTATLALRVPKEKKIQNPVSFDYFNVPQEISQKKFEKKRKKQRQQKIDEIRTLDLDQKHEQLSKHVTDLVKKYQLAVEMKLDDMFTEYNSIYKIKGAKLKTKLDPFNSSQSEFTRKYRLFSAGSTFTRKKVYDSEDKLTVKLILNGARPDSLFREKASYQNNIDNPEKAFGSPDKLPYKIATKCKKNLNFSQRELQVNRSELENDNKLKDEKLLKRRLGHDYEFRKFFAREVKKVMEPRGPFLYGEEEGYSYTNRKILFSKNFKNM